MAAIEPAGEKIVRNLQQAVERLHEDIARVELWAEALGCFAEPIPDYDPVQGNLNKFALTSAPSRQRGSIATAASRDAEIDARNDGKSGNGDGDGMRLGRADWRFKTGSDAQ